MRIERVDAVSFGPFQGQALDLAAGMTVVHGGNESGKSSWHAALYAGLCGMRRGRGARRLQDREFAERHQPWDGGGWVVGAVVQLADGRRIEFRHDLDALVDCRATDLVLGRDVSDEVMFDGAPDGARLLGLTRDTLVPTVCVRQADILGLLGDPGVLQESLQRAVATAGADATAEQALARIEEFRSNRIGSERRNSSRPLRAAIGAEEQAAAGLAEARAAQADYWRLLAQRDTAQRRAAQARQRLEAARAVEAEINLQRLEERLAEAQDLAARYPEPPPADAHAGDVQEAERALTLWEHRPGPAEPLEGPDSATLRGMLAEIPPPPLGDTTMHPEVAAARREWERAGHAVALHARSRADGPASAAGAPPGLSGGRRPAPAAAGAGTAAALALAAVSLFAAERSAGAAAAIVAALVLAAVAVSQRQRSQATAPDTQWEVEAARRWADATTAEAELRAVLASRGVDDGLDSGVADLLTRYEEACEARAAQAEQSGRAEILRARLAAREAAEAEARQRRQRRADATRRMQDAALAQGLRGRTAEDYARALRAWIEDQAALREEWLAAHRGWSRLQHLLEGATLEDLAREVASARARARPSGHRPAMADEGSDRLAEAVEAGAGVGPVAEPAEAEAVGSVNLESLAAEADEAAQAAAELRGRVADREGTQPSVAEAEEALSRARDELARLRCLEATLETARAFLDSARDRVHRSIAPTLAAGIEAWLPMVTADRYTEATVDPATLAVRVRAPGGAWRDAARLSHGTAEQVYLLLRIAMARHLATTGEPAPLVLDDITVQSDDERTQAILTLLHTISAERQVVVFSQERAVAEWAADALTGPRDSLVRLEPLPAGHQRALSPDPA